MDDLALLNEYANSKSEEAFGELVSRHLAMVYSSARRQVGESLAADVTQAVFVLLARKAGNLPANTILTAWLLTTTRWVCRATLRKEMRRQHREQEAADMPSDYEQIEIQSAWEKVGPVLDEGLAALSEKERSLVALRFFERKSHAEIATALGLSENASKKRLSRAVERLRKFFARRGITTGAVILLAAISQNAVQAAPVGLAVTVTKAATAGVIGASVATLVQTTLKLMTSIKIKIAAISGAAVLIVGVPIVATVLPSNSNDAIVAGSNGGRIERYEFQAARVTYSFPPTGTAAHTSVTTPEFAGEPLLSAQFSWPVASLNMNTEAMRVEVADENGNEFNTMILDSGFIWKNDGRAYWVSDVPVFPRRGKEIRLRLVDNETLLDEFTIPNPAPGPHPEWTAESIPVRQSDGDLEVALTEFRALQAGPKNGKSPKTECVFSFREQGRDTTGWVPAVIEMSDATGNHWRPSRTYNSPYQPRVENGGVRIEFPGALWPGESAWKIRGEFKRVADFPASESLMMAHIRIPDDQEIAEPHMQFNFNGATLEVVGVVGKAVTHEQLSATHKQALVNLEQARGCITVGLAGEILSRNRRLTFIRCTDEQGRAVELKAIDEPGTISEMRLKSYSLVLQAPEGAHELNLVMGVSEGKVFEFVAKPEQIAE
jgi:RNA polymerase sigma factor (sigma-70 family)